MALDPNTWLKQRRAGGSAPMQTSTSSDVLSPDEWLKKRKKRGEEMSAPQPEKPQPVEQPQQPVEPPVSKPVDQIQHEEKKNLWDKVKSAGKDAFAKLGEELTGTSDPERDRMARTKRTEFDKATGKTILYDENNNVIPETQTKSWEDKSLLEKSEATRKEVMSSFGVPLLGATKGAVDVVGEAGGALDVASKLSPMAHILGKTDNPIANELMDFSSQLKKNNAEYFKPKSYQESENIFQNPKLLVNPEYIVRSVSEQIPNLITMMATGGWGEGAIELGSYMEGRKEVTGETTTKDALVSGVIGVVNGVLGRWGFKGVFEGNPVLGKLVLNRMEKGALKIAAEAGLSTAGEMGSEYLQEVVPAIATKLIYDEGGTWTEVAKEANKQGLAAASQAGIASAPISISTELGRSGEIQPSIESKNKNELSQKQETESITAPAVIESDQIKQEENKPIDHTKSIKFLETLESGDTKKTEDTKNSLSTEELQNTISLLEQAARRATPEQIEVINEHRQYVQDAIDDREGKVHEAVGNTVFNGKNDIDNLSETERQEAVGTLEQMSKAQHEVAPKAQKIAKTIKENNTVIEKKLDEVKQQKDQLLGNKKLATTPEAKAQIQKDIDLLDDKKIVYKKSMNKTDISDVISEVAPALKKSEKDLTNKPPLQEGGKINRIDKNAPLGSEGRIIGKKEWAKELESRRGVLVEENDPVFKRFNFDGSNQSNETLRALKTYNNYVRREFPEGDILDKIENSYGKIIRDNVEDVTKAKKELLSEAKLSQPQGINHKATIEKKAPEKSTEKLPTLEEVAKKNKNINIDRSKDKGVTTMKVENGRGIIYYTNEKANSAFRSEIKTDKADGIYSLGKSIGEKKSEFEILEKMFNSQEGYGEKKTVKRTEFRKAVNLATGFLEDKKKESIYFIVKDNIAYIYSESKNGQVSQEIGGYKSSDVALEADPNLILDAIKANPQSEISIQLPEEIKIATPLRIGEAVVAMRKSETEVKPEKITSFLPAYASGEINVKSHTRAGIEVSAYKRRSAQELSDEAMIEKNRGVKKMREKIRAELEAGSMDLKQYQIIDRFIGKFEKQLGDVALFIEESGDAQGVFEYTDRMLGLFRENILTKGEGFQRTFIHEAWHSLTRFLPTKYYNTVEGMYKSELAKFKRQNPEFARKWKEAEAIGEKEVMRLFSRNIKNYRYYDINEWFAETMTDKSMSEMEKDFQIEPSDPIYKIIRFFKGLIQSAVEAVQEVIGVTTTAKIFKDFWEGKNDKMSLRYGFMGSKQSKMIDASPEAQKSPEKRTSVLDLYKDVFAEIQQQNKELSDRYGYKNYSDRDGYYDYEERVGEKMGGIEHVQPFELPDLVKLAKELTGKYPEIKKSMRSRLGDAQTGTLRIRVLASLFEEGKLRTAKGVLAHEIGHITDFLPDKLAKGGNIAGHIMSIHNFLRDKFTNPGVERQIDPLINQRKALQDQRRALKVEGKVPESNKKQDINLLRQIRDKNAQIKKLQENSFKNKEVREELVKLSKLWKPFDESSSSPGYVQYRMKSEELYADAISVLLNSPGFLKEQAPKFSELFFKFLDEKPDVKSNYFATQDLLNGDREEIVKMRQEEIRKDFSTADAIRKNGDEEKKSADKRFWERVRKQFDDQNYPIIKKQRAYEANGLVYEDDKNPTYLLEELPFVDNENYLMLDDLNKNVVQPLELSGVSMSDLGLYLFFNRIINDRAGVANPRGHTPKTAQEQIVFLKSQIGEEKYALLEEKSKYFHETVFKSVEQAVIDGSYNKEIFEEKIKPNKYSYATFRVIEHIDDYVSATIKKQIGTFKEVGNPFIDTVLKTVALNRLNAYQRAKRATLDMLGEEAAKSKKITSDGKLSIFKPARDKGAIEILEDGKLQSYDVDPYIAERFERDGLDNVNVVIAAIDLFNNKMFKPLVTTYNMGFALAFNPIRDFKRNYKAIKSATVGGLLKAYISSIKSGAKYSKGQLDEFTRSLVESSAINAPIYDYNFDPRDDEFGKILEKYGLISGEEKLTKLPPIVRKTAVKWTLKLLEYMRLGANTLEITSKIAGAKMRIKAGETGKELAYNIRNYTGTPNWTRKGQHTKTTNALFIFSNIMKEGIKSDFNLASNPTTRKGYWWKTVKIDLAPKVMMFAAQAGLMGVLLGDKDDDWLKRFFARVSEYDKTNYLIIPLGFNSDGKAVYMRIPHDESGRLISAALWKMLNFAKEGKTENLNEIFAIGAGQLPSTTPIISTTYGWGQYLSGKNPYDWFRGRSVIDDTTFTAGGWRSLKKMLMWTVNQSGVAQFATYDTSTQTTTENVFQTLPLLNRLIKISDYGLQEQENKLTQEKSQQSARNLLIKRETISEMIKSGKSDEEISEEVENKIKLDPESENYSRSITLIENDIAKERTKQETGARTAPLIKARTNDEKVRILKRYQGEMGEDFWDYLDQLYDGKVISDKVYEEF